MGTRILKWVAAAVILAAGAVLGVMYSIGFFASAPVYATAKGAIDGYDPVAYFVDGAAVMGDAAITTEWRGAHWLFANEANRQTFLAEPERYAPAYGGYCAYAMANDYTANADPNAFSIVEGRLFLNFDAATQQQWVKEQASMIAAGDHNWPNSRPGQAIAGYD